jgi:hypothetical protein
VLRETARTHTAQKEKEILLRRLPNAVVEQPPGPGAQESILYLHVQVLRAGIHGLWEQPSILLFQGLRFILPGKGGFVMDAYNEKVTAYRLSMSMVESMMRRGIISEKDYVVIQRMLAEKYGISLSSIFFK